MTPGPAITFIPATAEAIKSLADHSVFLGLGWSDILAIVALIISTTTTIGLYFAQKNLSKQAETDAEKRASERDESERIRRSLSSALTFHQEYNSDEMSKARSGAIKFVQANRDVDWISEPELSKFDKPGICADDLFKVMRFFHRLNVFRRLNEVDFGTANALLGSELAWWYGFAFEPMERRTYSRTMSDIVELARVTQTANVRWIVDVQRGQQARRAGP